MPKTTDDDALKISQSDQFTQSRDFVSIYANNVQFGVSRFDFQIIFAKVGITRDPAYKDTVIELANVTVTPAYAKALLMDMTKVISDYESRYGAIALPPELSEK